MRICKIISILICLGMVSSCANKSDSGTAIGAVTGGIVGSFFGKGEGRFLAMGLGALAGGFAGHAIGESLDEKDKQRMADSSHKALEFAPSGQSVKWHNPDSGNQGVVTPIKTYKSSTGDYCREFTQTIVVGGNQQKAYGKACRQADGQWQIVN